MNKPPVATDVAILPDRQVSRKHVLGLSRDSLRMLPTLQLIYRNPTPAWSSNISAERTYGRIVPTLSI